MALYKEQLSTVADCLHISTAEGYIFQIIFEHANATTFSYAYCVTWEWLQISKYSVILSFFFLFSYFFLSFFLFLSFFFSFLLFFSSFFFFNNSTERTL